MSKLIIVVTGSAYSPASGWRALQFATAALQQGIALQCVFFFRDGVCQSNALLSPASDETDLLQAWQALSQRWQVPLINCVSAALRRGVLSAEDAKENGKTSANLAVGFRMGGLGELVAGIESTTRMVRF